MDAAEYRRASLEQWERSAPGWGAHRDHIQKHGRPVSMWMVDAIAPQPGQTVLELAAGVGDTGFLAAELVQPGGRLICSDFALPMLDAARLRASELGLDNVEFRQLNAESLDLDTASVDAVLCRWGYMLMADPGAALRETRRVLRPGGRVALAAWDAPERNPWTSLIGVEVRRALDAPAPDPDAPGMFAFSVAGRVQGLLEESGFADARVEHLELEMTFPGLEAWWGTTLDLSTPIADLVSGMDEATRDEVLAGLARAAEPHTGADGTLHFPARALVASATA